MGVKHRGYILRGSVAKVPIGAQNSIIGKDCVEVFLGIVQHETLVSTRAQLTPSVLDRQDFKTGLKQAVDEVIGHADDGRGVRLGLSLIGQENRAIGLTNVNPGYELVVHEGEAVLVDKRGDTFEGSREREGIDRGGARSFGDRIIRLEVTPAFVGLFHA